MPNVRLCYLYRDAGNYKNFGEVIFRNTERLPIALLQAQLTERLIDGLWLEHEKWGLPALFFPVRNEDDHDWHEFVALEETDAEARDERDIGNWIGSR